MSIVLACLSPVHGFRNDSINLSVEEGTTLQIITIALDIKGNSILEARRSTPFFVLRIGFQLTCLGSSSDVRIPGELQVYMIEKAPLSVV